MGIIYKYAYWTIKWIHLYKKGIFNPLITTGTFVCLCIKLLEKLKKFTQVSISIWRLPSKICPTESSPLGSGESGTPVIGRRGFIPNAIMWYASRWTTIPCEFITTTIGLFLNSYFSLMYWIPKSNENFGNLYQVFGILDRNFSNFFCIWSTVQSTIGIHIILYWSFILLLLSIELRTEISFSLMSKSEKNKKTFSVSISLRLTCCCKTIIQNEPCWDRFAHNLDEVYLIFSCNKCKGVAKTLRTCLKNIAQQSVTRNI